MSHAANRPAFPVPSASLSQGVTVRDWFAAMALSGVVAKGLDVIGDRVVSESERNLMMARRAYALADAMLAASQTAEATSPAATLS